MAWKRVKANKGAPGVDGVTIREFPATIRDTWDNIRKSLMEGYYEPSPVLRVEIPKPSGGTRPLGIPAVQDRLIQQAVAQILTPYFDPYFLEFSYGFRPGRSAHDAVKKVREYICQGYKIAVDMDLSKFFDRVNHDVLMHRVVKRIRDKRVLRLIGKYLRAGVKVNGRLQSTRKGVPQGGPLSPLLANILLNNLDKELEKRGHKFVRYADDFIILVKSRRAGERVKRSIQRFLERRLKLKVNEDKSSVASTDQTTFLGFIFKGRKIRWSDKAFYEFKRRVKHLTGRSWSVSMGYRLMKLTQYVRGWMNYYGSQRKVRNLKRLGTSLNTAISAGMSRKGPWRLSRTLATQTGMTNQWVNIHYPAKAR